MVKMLMVLRSLHSWSIMRKRVWKACLICRILVMIARCKTTKKAMFRMMPTVARVTKAAKQINALAARMETSITMVMKKGVGAMAMVSLTRGAMVLPVAVAEPSAEGRTVARAAVATMMAQVLLACLQQTDAFRWQTSAVTKASLADSPPQHQSEATILIQANQGRPEESTKHPSCVDEG